MEVGKLHGEVDLKFSCRYVRSEVQSEAGMLLVTREDVKRCEAFERL